MFLNRKLLIATKHNKEKVIAPLFEKQPGVTSFVIDLFDTDTLGTFFRRGFEKRGCANDSSKKMRSSY